MNEKTSNPAEGASGQGGQKFRQESNQERLNRSKLRMEKRGGKLETARDKLANQKPPKKPGPVKRVGRTAGRGVHGFVHGKLYEVEQENVGTEGAHRSELAGEVVAGKTARFVKKRIRTHPARAAAVAGQNFCQKFSRFLSKIFLKNRLKRRFFYSEKIKAKYLIFLVAARCR